MDGSSGYSKVGIGLAGWVDKPSFISCTHVEIAMLGGNDLLKSIKSVCPVYFFELRMKGLTLLGYLDPI